MIEYVHTIEGITADRLQGFFEGWLHAPSAETHLRLLANSDEVMLAIDRRTGDVIGFVTAITDRVLTAHIPLLEVLPDYRHRGIGSELVRRMLARLGDLYAIDVLCDPPLQAFYGLMGMQPATGAIIRNRARQAGDG